MRALITLALFANLTATAQTAELIEVVEMPGTASELYRKAERWFVDTFNEAQEVIQLRDTTTHTLVGKGAQALVFYTTGMAGISQPRSYTYTIEVQAKEGRYRYRLYDQLISGAPVQMDSCCHTGCSYTGGKKMVENLSTAEKRMCEQLFAIRAALITSLKADMAKPKEDW